MAAPNTSGQTRGVNSPRPPNGGTVREPTQTRANRDESANHSTAARPSASNPQQSQGGAVISPKLTHEYFQVCLLSRFKNFFLWSPVKKTVVELDYTEKPILPFMQQQ